MPRKLIYIPLKILPQELTLHHIFKTFAALRIAVKEEGLYVMFQDAAVSEQFMRHLREGSFAEFENNCVEILGQEVDWRSSMEDCLLQLTSSDLLNYTDFLSNRYKQTFSITSSPLQDSPHYSVKSEEAEVEIGLTQLSNIIKISQENEGGNTFQNNVDQIGLFQVPLGQETVCLQLQFEPESESKKSFLSSSEDQHKTSIICDDKLSEQKMTSNNQATKEELKDFEEKVNEDGEEYMTEALTFQEEEFMRMNGKIGCSVNENCPQQDIEQIQGNQDTIKDKTTDNLAAGCTIMQNIVI